MAGVTPAARVGAVRRLLSAEVLAPADIVDRGVTVRDVSRANEVLLVRIDGGRGVALKSLPPDRCAAEMAVHDLAALRPGLRAVVPSLLAADRDAGWIARDLVVPGTTLTAAHRSAHGYPLAFARAVGRAIGAVHCACSDDPPVPPAPLPWALFALESTGPGSFAWDEAPLRAVLEAVADIDRHRAAFASARASWTAECLMHGDMKWDNCLVADSGAPQTEVRIIDWELAGHGDPAWGVAGIVQEYLGFAALAGLDVAGVRRTNAVELAAVGPLRLALRAFFGAYISTAMPSDVSTLAERAVRFAGVRLVQTSLEHASAGGAPTAAASALLELALAMLEEPDDVAERLRLTSDP